MTQRSASQGFSTPHRVEYETVIPNPKLKLLDQVREVMRLKHYSIRTERTYCEWLKRYVRFHGMKVREEMLPAEPKMEVFLSDLAVKGNVAVSTQNQAFNALLFVYREVLHVPVGRIESVRASRPVRVPVVLTVEEPALRAGTPRCFIPRRQFSSPMAAPQQVARRRAPSPCRHSVRRRIGLPSSWVS